MTAPTAEPLRLGLLRLTDSAPAIVAHELGFFADEGIEVRLSVEPSWANVADKLAHRALDAAVMLPPLVFAIALGLRGRAEPLVVPYCVSMSGDAIVARADLAAGIVGAADQARAFAAALGAAPDPTLAVVHDYSTHSLLLRYWLASVGAVAGRDYRLIVTPPAQTVEALASGRILGFCAGAPWGEVARRARVGQTVATSDDVWRNAPEKCLAARRSFAESQPERLAALMRALYRAAAFCEGQDNAPYVASLLARRGYLDLDSHAILASLAGHSDGGAQPRFLVGAATFPWRSHGLWFLGQMRRWGLVPEETDAAALVASVYRPDLYRAALRGVGAGAPDTDTKIEGAHADAWTLPAANGAIAMGPDTFCDGVLFDPAGA